MKRLLVHEPHDATFLAIEAVLPSQDGLISCFRNTDITRLGHDLRVHRPEIIICGGDNLQSTIALIRGINADATIIAIGQSHDTELVVQVMKAGADDYLPLSRLALLHDHLARSVPRGDQTRSHKFQSLADSAPLLVWGTDPLGQINYVNGRWQEFTGRPRRAELGEGWFDQIPASERPRVRHMLEEAIRLREPFQFNCRMRRRDGIYRRMLFSGGPDFDEQGDFTGFVGTLLDISEQHEAETKLARRAIIQTSLANFSRHALTHHDIAEISKEANRLICDTLLFQYSEIFINTGDAKALRLCESIGSPPLPSHLPLPELPQGLHIEQALILDENPSYFPYKEAIATMGLPQAVAAPINSENATYGFILGVPSEAKECTREKIDFIQAIAHIISTVYQRGRAEQALKESEQQLLASQKLEAVGLLAGGVAHDFNNLLTAIRCYSDMLNEDLETIAPDQKPKVEEILKATARASALTRQLLAFSRKQVLHPEPLDMNQVVIELKDLLRSLLSENISLTITPSQQPAWVEVDRNQIDQVIINLCINARDAMIKGGSLNLSISTVDTLESGTTPPSAGGFVRLAVKDTGSGIPLSVQPRIFQPFFTTKPVGRGTGLGLATCSVIVKNFHGSISFDSTPGTGTTFYIHLPQKAPSDYTSFYVDEAQPVTGSEQILVVEDDEVIASVTREILSAMGYEISVASGSKEALAFYEQPGTRFDLVLSDVVMPHMQGPELVRILCEKQSDLRIMFMSGYVGDRNILRTVQKADVPFLEKPFTRASLARRVREALDGPIRRI